MVLNGSNRNPCKVYRLTWSEFGSSLTTVAQNLRTHDDLTDVTISAGGKIYPAHKLILSAASPLLMELLKSTKCQHPILMLAGISSHDFETILDFIYQGEVKIDSEKLPSLLQAAQLLDIQALSPSALVLNSPQESFALSINLNQEPSFSHSNEMSCKNGPVSDKHSNDELESRITLQKRKRPNRLVESSESLSCVNSCKKSSSKNFEDTSNDESFVEIPKPVSSVETIGDLDNHEDDKKIISDLPVNCKLCGVTIRQSRNLRRHIDHMHTKPKVHPKSKDSTDKIAEDKSSSIPKKASCQQNDYSNNPNASGVLNFSDDSFNQLTEEIFNCTNASTTITSSEMQMSDPMNEIIVSHDTNMSASPALTSVKSQNSLSAMINSDFCPPSPSTAINSHMKSTKSMSDLKSTSSETFECANLGYACNMNDITLKELENQLFSVCFCSAENEDV